MSVIRFIADRITRARKRADAKRNKRELFRIALAFNRRHTNHGPSYQKGLWMCPACNTVHESIEWSFLTGLQFPACCDFYAGHRMFHDHATGSDA
jgi:hypothetical protein